LNRKVVIRLLVIAGGIGIILLSLFAFELGLDNDPGWGPRRTQLLLIGLGIILFASLYWITPKLVGHTFSVTDIEDKIQTQPANNKINIILLIILFSLAIYSYFWIITIGRIDKWPSGKNYYWKLTQAFQQGQVHLIEEPNPELAKMENPYDFQKRKGLEYLWDTTYYNGKYFLYWGPAPAVIGVFVNAITSKPVTDAGLVFSFVIGTALFSVLLLYEIYKKFQIPTWAFWGGILACMINVPLIWLLTRPTFYEVSISGGQFFLIAGFYFLFLGFRNPQPNLIYLCASSLAFGLSGATRINLLPAIIVLTAIVLLKIYFANQKNFSKSLSTFAVFLTPLILTAISLSWYNYIRFGSIFEFGHRYQLTGPALTANYEDISSTEYIIPNIYTYIFRLPSIHQEFPFFTILKIKQNMWPFFIRLPEYYNYTEPSAGILFIIPLIGFATFLLARLFWLFINGDIPKTTSSITNTNQIWFALYLLIYTFIQFSILLLFLYASVRYLLDVSQILIILSTLFVGNYVQRFDTNPVVKKIISVSWVIVSILTFAFGFMIGLTGDKNTFLNQNPALFYLMASWFN